LLLFTISPTLVEAEEGREEPAALRTEVVRRVGRGSGGATSAAVVWRRKEREGVRVLDEGRGYWIGLKRAPLLK
jgi:hypothetical protein